MVLRTIGHAFFAVTLIAIGVMDFVKGEFDATWPPVPKSIPAFLIYLCAFIYVACGIGLLLRRTAAIASRVLLVCLLAWLLLLRVPQVFMLHPTLLAFWGFGKTAVLVAAAWVLYVWFAGGKGLRIARALYGVALIPFGLAHFVYLKETVVLVPHWMGSPNFWAYFTGAAFIAAGIAVLVNVYARLAAILATVQIGALSLLVWAPRVAAGQLSAFQWGEVVVTVVLTAAAWVVADSYTGVPLLAGAGHPSIMTPVPTTETPAP